VMGDRAMTFSEKDPRARKRKEVPEPQTTKKGREKGGPAGEKKKKKGVFHPKAARQKVREGGKRPVSGDTMRYKTRTKKRSQNGPGKWKRDPPRKGAEKNVENSRKKAVSLLKKNET